MTNTYGAKNGLLIKSTYGNGAYVENVYDRYDRVTGIKYNGTQQFGYVYNANGLVSKHTDNINGKTYYYTYDLLGRLQRTDVSDGSYLSYTYDNVNNTAGTSYKYNGTIKTTSYTHVRGGIVRNVTYPNGATKTRALNAHAQVRPSSLTTPTGKVWSINRQYYTPTIGGVTYTTNVMGNLIYESIDRTFSYVYDGSGNISKITDRQGTNSTEKTYQYDELNQLIRENDPVAGKTTTYTYDNGGNILTKTEYTYTTGTLGTPTNTINYTYGNTEWKDLLTAYNGQNITYDQIGNPLTYYNGTQFTWNYGRKLSNAVLSDGTAISYKYNDSGIRTQKTVGGVTTDYFLDGSKIVAQKTGNNTTWYYYDGDGTREAIEYGGNVYYYFYNAQGDVVGLFDNNLNVVVEYIYDSWGNVLSITGSLANTLGQDNPFRYRGYYFDSDTGLYYLNSRYYDANTGRFINADGLVQTGQGLLDKNMFAYCMNNPVNFLDPYGTDLLAVLALIGVVAIGGALIILKTVVEKPLVLEAVENVQTIYDSSTIANDTIDKQLNYTMDSLKYGTNVPNYKPNQDKNSKGRRKNFNDLSEKEYKERCIQSYKNMLDLNLISPDDTWESLGEDGQIELAREVLFWDTAYYYNINDDHLIQQDENVMKW